MGNTGVNFNLEPTFGWDTGMGSEGTFSAKEYISDGKSLNLADAKVEWLPLNFQFDIYSNVATTVFGQRKADSGSVTRELPRLRAAADGSLVMVSQDAYDQSIDRWYVCGRTLVWALGKAAPDDQTCVKVSLVKVPKP
jgi:hypothetical protein